MVKEIVEVDVDNQTEVIRVPEDKGCGRLP